MAVGAGGDGLVGLLMVAYSLVRQDEGMGRDIC